MWWLIVHHLKIDSHADATLFFRWKFSSFFHCSSVVRLVLFRMPLETIEFERNEIENARCEWMKIVLNCRSQFFRVGWNRKVIKSSIQEFVFRTINHNDELFDFAISSCNPTQMWFVVVFSHLQTFITALHGHLLARTTNNSCMGNIEAWTLFRFARNKITKNRKTTIIF